LGFLHFEPFSAHAIFHRHILQPLTKDPQNGATRLRELLRTICLRRDERLLKLPESRFEQVQVAMREDERAQYDMIMRQCAREIDDAVSSRSKIKKYNILFTAIMKLRRACNHGTMVPTSTQNTNTDQGCDFCCGADEDRLALVRQDKLCSECGRQLLSPAPSRTSVFNAAGGTSGTSTIPSIPSANGALDDAQSPKQGISSKVQAVMDCLGRLENGSRR
jgi:SWI/SNF-related matrix-associated actin-dependent regulator of chromatin subfamily A3